MFISETLESPHVFEDSFSVDILRDLISRGFMGEELIKNFIEERKNIKQAIRTLSDEANEIAAGERQAATTKDIFGEE